MLQSMMALQGYTVRAEDGDVGSMVNFYFDDRSWTIRYFVVETGNWMVGRRVLISPLAFDVPKWEKRAITVKLPRTRIKSSPRVDADKPVSRRMEEALHEHYGWLPYWLKSRGKAAVDVFEQATENPDDGPEIDLNLRSAQEVVGYDVQATDGKIGHVNDLIVDDETWEIRYVVVDVRDWLDWLPGKRVLISPNWISVVTWPERNVYVDLSQETIKDSPEFDPTAPVNQAYEVRLYDYYGRPKHWTRVQQASE